MAIYDANGIQLAECFNANGDSLEYAYDLNGNVIFEGAEAPTDPYLKNRILVFEDNFTGDSLDTSKWDYEIGYCRNNESQHYRPENAIVSDGVVNLKAIREHYAGDTTRNSTWTSASIHTSNRFEAFYGRWQAKIKFPKLVGSFGAFWLLGEGLEFGYNDDGTRNYRLGPVTWSDTIGVRCGEIDITETIPGSSGSARSNLWKYTSASSAGVGSSSAIDISEWHIYEMEWTESTMQMMVDGVVYKTYDLSSSDLQQYRMPSPTVQNGFYMILNQAVGASGGTPASSTNEMDMLVDWVRVYAPSSYTNSQIYADSISIDSELTLSVGDDVAMGVTWNPVETFDRTTRWSSSNENVVTAHSGRIIAVGTGTAIVTVTTNNGKTATCLVRVGNQTFSVLGDSYSAYDGDVTPSTNAVWYNGAKNNVTNSSMMWYRLYESATGKLLSVNNSYSGAPICYDGYGSGNADAKNICFLTRMDAIRNPTTIFVFGGTNDSWVGVGQGEYKYSDWSESDFVYFRPALAYMLDYLKTNHQSSSIVFIKNDGLSSDISTSIDTICSHYGVTVVALSNIDKSDGHPTATGMQQIATQIRTALDA